MAACGVACRTVRVAIAWRHTSHELPTDTVAGARTHDTAVVCVVTRTHAQHTRHDARHAPRYHPPEYFEEYLDFFPAEKRLGSV